MKRYADIIARQKRIRPPPGYATSLSTCRAFLEQHAPRKAGSGRAADAGCTVASPAQVSSGESNRPARKRRQGAGVTAGGPAHKKAARGRKTGKHRLNDPLTQASPRLARRDASGNTPLKIPYGNKEVALELGARYDAGGCMRRRVWIFLPSKKGAGCNAWQPFLRCWITTKVAYEGRKAICRPAVSASQPGRTAKRRG